MTYLNRNTMNKFWPIERKGTKYLAIPSHNKNEAIPLVVVLRDILKIVRNKKELQSALNEKNILINQKEIRNTNYPVMLFDVISIPNAKKNYLTLLSENKKFIFEEVSDKESQKKVYKVFNKKTLTNKKLQLNLSQNKNILSEEKVNIGDSLILDLKSNKIIKIIPLQKGNTAFVIKGKHAGIKGKVSDIIFRGGKSLVKISKDDKKINVWIKNIIMLE